MGIMDQFKPAADTAVSTNTPDFSVLDSYEHPLRATREKSVGIMDEINEAVFALNEETMIYFMALCRLLQNEVDVWCSKSLTPYTEMDGQFVLGIGRKPGEQITLHLPLEYWELVPFAKILKVAPAYDGHTLEDIRSRIASLTTKRLRLGGKPLTYENSGTRGLNFSLALAALQMENRVARSGWNGSGVFIELDSPDENSNLTHPYLLIDTTGLDSTNAQAPRECVPWIPSQTDLLSTDWYVVD